MSSIQEQLFENDADELQFELLDPINRAKDAYMALKKFEDKEDRRRSYQKAYNKFEEYYEQLDESDKRKFEQWKEDHNYQW